MNNDHWVKNDMMFICDGNGYCLNKYLQTVCVGPVDDDGNPGTPPEAVSVGVENQREPVTKFENIENHMIINSHEQKDGIMLHHKKRGRPRKTGDDVCRMTKYRRKKELQPAMVL